VTATASAASAASAAATTKVDVSVGGSEESGDGGGSRDESVGGGGGGGGGGSGDDDDEEEEEEEEDDDNNNRDSPTWAGTFARDETESWTATAVTVSEDSVREQQMTGEAALREAGASWTTRHAGLCVGQCSRWHFSLQ
jgi:hypothetical protein